MYMHVTDLSGEQVKWNKFPKFWGFVLFSQIHMPLIATTNQYL